MAELKLTNNPCKFCNGEIDEGKPLCGGVWLDFNKGDDIMIDWNDKYYHRCEYCKHCGPTTTTYTGDGPIHKCWCKLDGIPGPLHDYYGKSCSRWEHTTIFDDEAK